MMNKQDMITAMAEAAEISKAAAERALNTFTESVTATLKERGKVAIAGFGSWETSERPERVGRNPQTGESMTIAASTAAKFKPAKALKDTINQ